MSPPVTNDPQSAKQWTMILGLIALCLNVFFFFLSASYFSDHAKNNTPGYGPDALMHTRLTFLGFTLVTAGIGAVAAFRSWQAGFGLTILAGIAAIVAAVGAFVGGLHPILAATLFVLGLVFGALTWFALARRSRAAWAFLVGLNWMCVATTLFGATKVRNALGTGLWTALIVPGLFAVAAVALVAVRGAFDDASTPDGM